MIDRVLSLTLLNYCSRFLGLHIKKDEQYGYEAASNLWSWIVSVEVEITRGSELLKISCHYSN